MIPEWVIPRDLSKTPRDGAKLYKVVDGKEELIAKYDSDSKKFIPEKGVKND